MNEQMQVQGCKAPTGYVECYKRCGRFAKAYSEHSAVVTCCHCFGRGDAARIARLEEQYGSDWTPPVAPAPKAPEGVPAGYRLCTGNCGRWTFAVQVGRCWTCLGLLNHPEAKAFPDWAPPAPHPERRAVEVGQTWEYDERSPSLSGERRIVQRHKDGTLAVFHEDGEYNHSNLEFLVNHARLVSAPSPASEPAKACNGRCMMNVGTTYNPVWKVCLACGDKIGRNIAEAKPTKPAEKAKDVRVQCCRIGGEMAKEARPCPFHMPKVTAGPLMLLNDFDLLPDATEDDQRRLALWLDNAEDGP